MRLGRLRGGGFTLVEVILAILIISAIITVLLYFYQRAVEVRQTVLEHAEFLSASRMLMEQVTGELRTARVVEDQFVGLEGSSNAITFVCTSLPQTPRWILSSNESLSLPAITDLKRVNYRLLTGTNAFDIRGLDRTEEWLTAAAFTAGTNSTEFVNAAGTNVAAEGDTNLLSTNEVQLIRPPLSDKIKFLQFRYWTGTNWVESWNTLELPAGVEVTLGHEAPPADSAQLAPAASQSTEAALSSPGSSSSSIVESGTSADSYPFEVFRRVIFLPNSVPSANKVNLTPAEQPIY